MEACAVAVGARRGREGNLVRTLIRPNGWCKVARSAETRQKTVGEGEEKEKKKNERRLWMGQEDESVTAASVRVAGRLLVNAVGGNA